ncbi:MAG TPA: ISL3 family transposase [Thermoanaerobaculia bacterium]|nr:ISL3 family transposase [Thermoanaerobaculia bacterium]
MQLKSILNRVEKIPGFVYEKVEWSEDGKEIEIRIRARKNSWAVCSGCGSMAVTYDQLRTRRFAFVPLWQIPVRLLYRMRRVECHQCGVKVERVPWAEGKSQASTTYLWFLAAWAGRMSWTDVAKVFGTTWNVVSRAVEHAVNWGREHVSLEGIRSIGVDEILHRRGSKAHGGPRYLTLVYQIDEGIKRLLWVGRDRREETMHAFFDWLGPDRSEQIQFVCSDMWPAYLKVIRLRATKALQILDRFHIAAMVNKAIDRIRAEEIRELKKQGRAAVLTNARWLFLKRPANLSDDQHEKLATLLRMNLRIVRAYLLKEGLQRFWTYTSPRWAAAFLESWCSRVMRSRVESLKRVARTLRKHRELMLNWFRADRLSAGTVEGLNNKAKVTMRKSYGFRTFKVTELALYHSLADLPQPILAHRFW